uniref:Uncharacterized protein n=1 Tax=Arion vulgaris TaxID=1028688 RepID=A0A0B7B1Q1_9EUPU
MMTQPTEEMTPAAGLFIYDNHCSLRQYEEQYGFTAQFILHRWTGKYVSHF